MAYGKGSVNKVVLLGRLGKDPDLKYTPSGAAVANFSIATDLCWKDKESNEEKTATEWHRLVCWRQIAETASKYLKKGNQVYIEGRLQTRSWDDKDGIKRYTTEVVVENLVLIGSKQGNGGVPLPESEFPEGKSVADEGFEPPAEPGGVPMPKEENLPF